MGLRAVTAPALLFATLYNRLGTIQEALEGAGWEVLACQKPDEALEHLQHTPIAAVFCDEYLRGASPAGFLAWSRRVAPELPFYLFAMNADSARITGPHAADEVLPFPPRAGTLPRPGAAAGTKAVDAGVPLQGRRDLLPLTSLLDMMGIARQSGVIHLEGERAGIVALDHGVLQHVETDTGHTGIRALAELIAVEDGSFRVDPYRPPKRRTLATPVATALTEATKLLDEVARDRVLLDAVLRTFPDVRGVATGYPLGQAAGVGRGDAATAFELARRLLEANRGVLGKITHLCAESEDGAVAVVAYGEGNLLAATAAPGKSLRLLAALAQAVRGGR